MEQVQKNIDQYMKEIDKLLFGPREDRQKFLARYEKSIYESMKETRREYDYDQLVLYFGAPEDIAENYAYAFEPEVNVIKRQDKKKKYIVSLICALVMIVCLSLFTYMVIRSTSIFVDDYKTNVKWVSR